MIKETRIRAIGNAAGTTIPREMLDRLGLKAGEPAYLVETPEGILITPYDPNFKRAMESYAKVSARYRNALKELA